MKGFRSKVGIVALSVAMVGVSSLGFVGTASADEGSGYGGDAPACTMYATPDTIASGEGTTLDWDLNQHVVKAYLHGKGSTSWRQEVSLDGSWWISGILDTRGYTLTVENEAGEMADCDAYVTVEDGTSDPLTCDMYADPATIMENGGTNLIWSSTGNIISAQLHPTGSTSYFAEVGPSGSWWISGINNDRSYSVTLTDVDGNTVTCDAPISVEDEVVVVTEDAPSCEIHANPGTIESGGMTTLIWHNSANATQATIDGGIGNVNADTGWHWMNGVTTAAYTMTVENTSGDTATCTANISME